MSRRNWARRTIALSIVACLTLGVYLGVRHLVDEALEPYLPGLIEIGDTEEAKRLTRREPDLLQRQLKVSVLSVSDQELLDEEMCPLSIAAHAGHTDLMRWFIDQGADVNAREGMDMTALHRAAEARRLSAVQLLTAKGADVNAQTVGGFTPVHAAACSGDDMVVRFLIQCGAKNMLTGPGNGAFHYASTPEVIHELYAQGWDWQPWEGEWESPLTSAAIDDEVDVVVALLQHMTAADIKRECPASLVEARGRSEAIISKALGDALKNVAKPPTP